MKADPWCIEPLNNLPIAPILKVCDPDYHYQVILKLKSSNVTELCGILICFAVAESSRDAKNLPKRCYTSKLVKYDN